jgi:hypothetical protein
MDDELYDVDADGNYTRVAQLDAIGGIQAQVWATVPD